MKWMFFVLVLVPVDALASVYKCELDGVTTYSQTPCGAKSVKVYEGSQDTKKAVPDKVFLKACQVMHAGEWFQYPANECTGKGVYEVSPSGSSESSQINNASASLLPKTKAQYHDDSMTICRESWTKRGELDLKMYLHCLEGQEEGYNEVLSMGKYVKEDFYKNIGFPHCYRQWTKRGVTDTRMLAHCLKQEIDSYNDVVYYRNQYDADSVNAVVSNALVRFGSWNMAAFKVKAVLEGR